MKKVVVIMFLVLNTSLLFAQMGPEFFLGRIPPVPSDACSMSYEQRQNFRKNLSELTKEVFDEISKRKKVIKTDVKNSQDQIKKEKAREIGLSDDVVQKLSQKHLSSAEKKAIIDQVLKDQKFASLRNTKSEAGKQAWAKGYATQQQAKMQSRMENPDSVKSEEQVKMEKNLEKNSKMNDLGKELKLIEARMHAADQKFENQMKDFNKEDSVATIVLNKLTKPLQDKLDTVPAPPEDEQKLLRKQIQRFQCDYCSKLTPQLCKIVGDCYISLHTLTPDYKRLDEINAELNKGSVGMNKEFSSSGLSHLEAIYSYLGLLGSVTKYGTPCAADKSEF